MSIGRTRIGSYYCPCGLNVSLAGLAPRDAHERSERHMVALAARATPCAECGTHHLIGINICSPRVGAGLPPVQAG